MSQARTARTGGRMARAGGRQARTGHRMSDVIDTAPNGETAQRFLRRGAVVTVALLAIAGLAVVLTSRDDTRAARELCTAAARTQLAAPVGITSVDRTDDDAFVVRGATGTRSFTCLVTREPISDRWELASLSL